MMIVPARAPWKGADTPIQEIGKGRVFLQAEIDLCLNCPYDTCISCLTGGKTHKKGRPRKENGAA
ncbi:MAG TPA: hypothetical protein DCR31_06275 [Ruminococcaceae bacterium]|nr:hypothetical protein [Oscillospiraceae bacterium]